MTLQHVHPGGFFWQTSRSDRELRVRDLAAKAGRLAVITKSAEQANEVAERLTLSGLPVLLATDVDRRGAADSFVADGVSSLVATHEYVLEHGPLPAAAAVHTRLVTSLRQYVRRLSSVPAPVHISFVVPEDIQAARAMVPLLSDDAVIDLDADHTLESVLGERPLAEVAAVVNSRRRFLLTR
ncbi:MAG: hypothetical protein ACR2P0_11225 [Acidimicrobiales bacterium]